jgi:hypothetical protein
VDIPHGTINQFVSQLVNEALIAFVLENEAQFALTEGGARILSSKAHVPRIFIDRLRSDAGKMQRELGMRLEGVSSVNTNVVALGQGARLTAATARAERTGQGITFLYTFSTGQRSAGHGTLLLADPRRAGVAVELQIGDRRLVFFSSRFEFSILRVHPPSKAFHDSQFVIYGRMT